MPFFLFENILAKKLGFNENPALVCKQYLKTKIYSELTVETRFGVWRWSFYLLWQKKICLFFYLRIFLPKYWDSMGTLVSSIWKQKFIVNSQWNKVRCLKLIFLFIVTKKNMPFFLLGNIFAKKLGFNENPGKGGYRLQDLSISQVIDHMTC